MGGRPGLSCPMPWSATSGPISSAVPTPPRSMPPRASLRRPRTISCPRRLTERGADCLREAVTPVSQCRLQPQAPARTPRPAAWCRGWFAYDQSLPWCSAGVASEGHSLTYRRSRMPRAQSPWIPGRDLSLGQNGSARRRSARASSAPRNRCGFGIGLYLGQSRTHDVPDERPDQPPVTPESPT